MCLCRGAARQFCKQNRQNYNKEVYLNVSRETMTRQELFAYIEAEYNVTPDYPWLESPEGAVFRHGDNRKWFALSMPIPRRYAYPGEEGEVDAVNLKCDPVLSAMVRGEAGILPAYHMSKVHWITVLLDGTADDDRLRFLIRHSFELTKSKKPQIKKKGS